MTWPCVRVEINGKWEGQIYRLWKIPPSSKDELRQEPTFTVLLWTTSGRIGRERGVSFFFSFSRSQTPHGQCNRYNRRLELHLIHQIKNKKKYHQVVRISLDHSAVQFFPVPDTIRNLDYRIALASAAGFTVLLWTTSGRIGRERGVSFFSPFLVLKLLTVSVTVTIGG